MVSKTRVLLEKSLEVIRVYGLSYFLRVASNELSKQKFDLFRNPTEDYYFQLESKTESQDALYRKYMKNFELEISENILQYKNELLEINPKFSIVVIASQDNVEQIDMTIKTIQEQIHSNHEIIILYDKLDNSFFDNKKESHQNITYISTITDLQKNFNGDYICFLQSGDKLSKNSLFKVSQFLNKNIDSDMVYTDHDYFDEDNLRINPFFKPDWSSYLFDSVDYISQFLVTKKEIFNKIQLGDDFTNLKYYISKKIIESSNKIGHIASPLYSINYELISKNHSENNKNSTFEKTKIINDLHSLNKSIEFNLKNEPLVTIIIPTRNNKNILERCIKSIKKSTTYKNFEIIIVDNNSTDSNLKQYYASLSCMVLNYDGLFNFSKMNNLAVKHAKGDFFLFLNDDTKILKDDWLNNLVSLCNQNDVGVVGPKLILTNHTIQHAGSIILESGASFHPFQNIAEDSHIHFNFLNVIRECSAVTGACLITKKEIFNEINGFDEDFDVYYGDTDLCLKIIDLGFKILYTPYTKLIHEGSHSIKAKMQSNTLEEQAHFAVENYYHFITKWPKLKNGDQFYNRNLGWDYSIKSIE